MKILAAAGTQRQRTLAEVLQAQLAQMGGLVADHLHIVNHPGRTLMTAATIEGAHMAGALVLELRVRVASAEDLAGMERAVQAHQAARSGDGPR